MGFSNFLDIDETTLWLEPDTVLANVITAMVNMMGMPIGITLFIKGTVISGTLVSEKEYLEKLTEVFQSAAKQSINPNNKEEAEIIEEIFDFTKLGDNNLLFGDEDEEADDEDVDSAVEDIPVYIRYLHIRDFSILTPNPPLSFGASSFPILRIRLTAIDGWMLGHSTPHDFEVNDFGDKPDKGEVLH